MITQERLRELFQYKDGNLYWIKNKGIAKSGDIAGSLDNKGYISIGVDGKYIGAHRAVFLYFKGYLPKFIDHIDGNPINNNIENLRPANFLSNGANSKKQATHKGRPTSSKWKGVSYNKASGKFVAMVCSNGRHFYCGRFNSEDDAAMAYNEKAVELFGEFARQNVSDLNL
jgi:hypothetical protein